MIASKAPHLVDRQGVLKEGGEAEPDAGVRSGPLVSHIKSLQWLSMLTQLVPRRSSALGKAETLLAAAGIRIVQR